MFSYSPQNPGKVLPFQAPLTPPRSLRSQPQSQRPPTLLRNLWSLYLNLCQWIQKVLKKKGQKVFTTGCCLWTPSVVTVYGLPLWSLFMDSLCGHCLWTPSVVIVYGLPLWSLFMDSLCGHCLWTPSVVTVSINYKNVASLIVFFCVIDRADLQSCLFM